MRSGFQFSDECGGYPRGLPLWVVWAGLALVLSGPAAAQSTVIVGGSGLPAVEVNLDVLNDSGWQGPSRRRLLMPGEQPFSRVVLTPPGEERAAPPPRPKLVQPAPADMVEETIEETVAFETPEAPPAMPEDVDLAGGDDLMPGDDLLPDDELLAEDEAGGDEPTELAALMPETEAIATEDDSDFLTLGFSSAETALSDLSVRRLNTFAAGILNTDDRIQVKAYAGQSGELAGSARRLSLKRALAVRSQLIERGIRSTRIDVRALGVAQDDGPSDRVDIVILEQ